MALAQNTSDLWGDNARYNAVNGTGITITVPTGDTTTTYGAEFNLEDGSNIIKHPNGGSLNLGTYADGAVSGDPETNADLAEIREIGLELLNENPTAEIKFDSNENAWVIQNGNTTSYYSINKYQQELKYIAVYCYNSHNDTK